MSAEEIETGVEAAPEPRRVAVDIDQGSISALVWDGPDPNAPVIHFAHANGFNAQTYRTLFSPLADQFRILAPDLRGHGMTDLPAVSSQPRTVMLFAEDLVRHLQAQGVGAGHKALLMGHSLGGTVSLAAAALRPDLVSGLLLLDPVILPPWRHWLMAMKWGRDREMKTTPIAVMAAKRRSVFESAEAVYQSYKGRGAFKTWPDAVLRDYVEGGVRARGDGQVELACAPEWEATTYASHGHSPWREVKRVKAPVELLLGEKDSTCAAAEAARIARRRPDWKQERVPGTSHFLPMEEPDLVRARVRAFWAETSGVSTSSGPV